MSVRKILSGVAMAMLSGGCLAADAASSCSPVLSEVDVKDGLKVHAVHAVQADCGLPVQSLNRKSAISACRTSTASASQIMMSSHYPRRTFRRVFVRCRDARRALG